MKPLVTTDQIPGTMRTDAEQFSGSNLQGGFEGVGTADGAALGMSKWENDRPTGERGERLQRLTLLDCKQEKSASLSNWHCKFIRSRLMALHTLQTLPLHYDIHSKSPHNSGSSLLCDFCSFQDYVTAHTVTFRRLQGNYSMSSVIL